MGKKKFASLPSTIFAKKEEDGDTSYLVADDYLHGLVGTDDGEVTVIGEYQLVAERKYTTKVTEAK